MLKPQTLLKPSHMTNHLITHPTPKSGFPNNSFLPFTKDLRIKFFSVFLAQHVTKTRNLPKKYKVKPALKTTSEQGPPLCNDYLLTTCQFINDHSKSHFYQAPRVVIVHRFDCIQWAQLNGVTLG
jgi:hypothetical protein